MTVRLSRDALGQYTLAVALLFGPPLVILAGVIAFLVAHREHVLKVSPSDIGLFLLWPIYSLVWHGLSGGHVLSTEVVQVTLGLLLFSATRSYVERTGTHWTLARRFMWVGIVYSILEILVRPLQLNYGAVLGSDANNVAAQFALFFLIVPAFDRNVPFPRRIMLLALGAGVAFVNESRTVALVALLAVLIQSLSFVAAAKLFVLCGCVSVLVLGYLSGTIGGVLSTVFDTQYNFSNLERLKMLEYGWNHVRANLAGTGLGSSILYMKDNGWTILDNYPHVHNTPLFMAMETGMAGLLVYAYLFGGAVFRGAVIYLGGGGTREATVAILMVLIGLVDSLFYSGTIATIIWLQLGMIFGVSKVRSRSKEDRRAEEYGVRSHRAST